MSNEDLQIMIERYKKQLREFSQKNSTPSGYNENRAYEQSMPVFANDVQAADEIEEEIADEIEDEKADEIEDEIVGEKASEKDQQNIVDRADWDTYSKPMTDMRGIENDPNIVTERTPQEMRRDAGELWGLNGLRDVERFRNGIEPAYDSQVWDMDPQTENSNENNKEDNISQRQGEIDPAFEQRRYFDGSRFYERVPYYEELPERRLTSAEAEYGSFDKFLQINPARGLLKVEVYAADRSFPISNARVVVLKSIAGRNYAFYDVRTNAEGIVDELVLPTKSGDVYEGVAVPFTGYSVSVEHPDYENMILRNVFIFDHITSVLPVDMEPLTEDSVETAPVRYDELLYMSDNR